MNTLTLFSRCNFMLSSLFRCIPSLLLGLLINASAFAVDKASSTELDTLKNIDATLGKLSNKNITDLILPSVAQEVEAGRLVAASLLAVAPPLDDPKLQGYVNQLGRWIASHSERPDLPWHFGVIDSTELNAFAIPGGYILLTRGLYQRLSDPSELAGVLAHEIAHVVARHHLKAELTAKIISEGTRRVGDILASDEKDATRRFLGTGASLVSRKLDKSTEFEADQMGVVLATRAGFEPFGLPSVLTKLEAVPNSDNRVSQLFHTHPLPAARLAQLDKIMGDRLIHYTQSGEPEPLPPIN